VLNRLRAPAKKEAKKALSDWESKLRGKFDQLFQLMDRASVIVGPTTQLDSRGFDGKTLSLCRESIHEVDELFIMSSATDSVIDRVEKLVEPKSPWGLLVNAFFSRRYRRAVELLGSQPIGFDRDQGLEAILEPAQKINPEAAGRSLLGNPEDYEPFRMSFEQLISAYDEKQAAAVATVDRLEHCIDGLPMLLLPRHYWAQIMQEVEAKIGVEAAATLYHGGTYKAAYFWCEKEAVTHGISGVEVFNHYMKRMSERGWGKFTVEAIDPLAGTGRIRLDNSATALAYGKETGRNVCHSFNGALCGSMEYVAADAGQPILLQSREIQCAANGADHCLFEVAPKT
jgi:predicted hydrocarbon binding protein